MTYTIGFWYQLSFLSRSTFISIPLSCAQDTVVSKVISTMADMRISGRILSEFFMIFEFGVNRKV